MEVSINRALVPVLAVAALTVALFAGQAVVAAAEAQAQPYCGAWKDGTARTSSRFGRVRTRSCLEAVYGHTRSIQQVKVDKPTGCFTSVSTTGAGVTCPPSAYSAWPEFHGFELTTYHDGAGYRCNWGAQGSGAKTFDCYSPWKWGYGKHTAKGRACYDVKDDGDAWRCINETSFSYTF